MSHKRNTPKPRIDQRIAAPLAKQDEKGKAVLMCPFCKPSHVLIPGTTAKCGTDLQVRAVQMMFNAKYEKDMVCVKCGKGGGRMVRFQNSFVHADDCTPGVATLTEAPKFSTMARVMFHLPDRIKELFKTSLGEIMPVAEVTPDGTRTGKTLGYFFYKG